ncbi:MAG: 5'-nucleotidase C-terminal domain-containing protein, partial [Sulfuricurvum sp.]|nr:5'-nucleotidase C-terminal domain-containing protein [Sulfuricurvum sp.]
GTTVLGGEQITMDNVYDMTAITYPNVYTFEMGGLQIRNVLEDIADNVFNANPLYQQGGDMSRLGGVTYNIKIGAPAGKRITNIMVKGKPLDDRKVYKVSSWGGNLQNAGTNLNDALTRPVYDITAGYIRKQKKVDISGNSNVNILDYDCGCPAKGSKRC